LWRAFHHLTKTNAPRSWEKEIKEAGEARFGVVPPARRVRKKGRRTKRRQGPPSAPDSVKDAHHGLKNIMLYDLWRFVAACSRSDFGIPNIIFSTSENYY
jgi:hypothetical protein